MSNPFKNVDEADKYYLDLLNNYKPVKFLFNEKSGNIFIISVPDADAIQYNDYKTHELDRMGLVENVHKGQKKISIMGVTASEEIEARKILEYVRIFNRNRMGNYFDDYILKVSGRNGSWEFKIKGNIQGAQIINELSLNSDWT